jgi:hypothetical protein
MGNLFGRNEEACSKWQDWLDAAPGSPDGDAPLQNLQQFAATLSASDKLHLDECHDCRIATDAWLVARQSLQTLTRQAAPAPPWFAARVMAAIAARQEESLRPAGAWTIVPRFAARLAWASAAILLVASTWLYQKPLSRPSAPATVNNNAAEGLFDTQPPPVTEDEVLVSLAEHDHE